MSLEINKGSKISFEDIKKICEMLAAENPDRPLREAISLDKISAITGEQKHHLSPIVKKIRFDLERKMEEKNKINPDIQKYVEIILNLVGRDFEEKIKNLKDEIEDRGKEITFYIKEVEKLFMKIEEGEKEIRKGKEELAQRESEIKLLKEEVQRKEREIQKGQEITATYENKIMLKEEKIQSLESEMRKINEENETRAKEVFDKERKNFDLEKEIETHILKVKRMEGILKVKEENINDINKNLILEQEEVKKSRKELIKNEQELFRHKSEIEKLKNEIRLLQDSLLEYKNKIGTGS